MLTISKLSKLAKTVILWLEPLWWAQAKLMSNLCFLWNVALKIVNFAVYKAIPAINVSKILFPKGTTALASPTNL